jgi:hypothetical protein
VKVLRQWSGCYDLTPDANPIVGEIDEIEHGQHEHAEAEALLAALADTDPTSARYDEVLDKVIDAVTHHVQEEEANVLPRMRSGLDENRLAELGRAFAASRARHLGDQPGEATKQELLQQARNAGIDGAATMTRDQLAKALQA